MKRAKYPYGSALGIVRSRNFLLHLQKPTLKKPKELFFVNALNEIKKEETEI